MKKLLILSFSLVLFTACSDNKNEETKNSQVKETTEVLVSESLENVEVKPNSRDNPNPDDNIKDFKEDLDNSTNEIWYMTSADIAKDSKIETYLVINDQKISIYELDNKENFKTLGELTEMTDEDILSYIKSEREKVDVKHHQENANLLFSTKPVPYKIAIETDATGNKTVAEQISADFETDSDGDGLLFKYNFTMNSVMYLIYSQKYIGFEVGYGWNDPNEKDYRTRILRKRKSENDLILMDQPTTEGIEVDGN